MMMEDTDSLENRKTKVIARISFFSSYFLFSPLGHPLQGLLLCYKIDQKKKKIRFQVWGRTGEGHPLVNLELTLAIIFLNHCFRLENLYLQTS